MLYWLVETLSHGECGTSGMCDLRTRDEEGRPPPLLPQLSSHTKTKGKLRVQRADRSPCFRLLTSDTSSRHRCCCWCCCCCCCRCRRTIHLVSLVCELPRESALRSESEKVTAGKAVESRSRATRPDERKSEVFFQRRRAASRRQQREGEGEGEKKNTTSPESSIEQ